MKAESEIIKVSKYHFDFGYKLEVFRGYYCLEDKAGKSVVLPKTEVILWDLGRGIIEMHIATWVLNKHPEFFNRRV